jgi:hypothetical protein
MLSAGYGGLVLCVKPDEATRWISRCRRANRDADIIRISPGGENKLNILDYEYRRHGRESAFTTELAAMMQSAMDGGQRAKHADDPFWEFKPQELLINTIELDVLCAVDRQQLSILSLLDTIRNVPQSVESSRTFSDDIYRRMLEDKGQPVWNGECYRKLKYIQSREYGIRNGDRDETIRYFTEDLPWMAPETRTGIVATLMGRLAGLARSPFRELFATNTTVTPEDTFSGRIIILDLPIKTYGEVGRFAQVLFKLIWQRAVERRGSRGRSVFLWADEGQHFVTRSDMLFLQTARESRASTVYITQSVANIYAALNEGGESNHSADSFLGNFQTMIFHANACPVTNEWASRVFQSDFRSVGGMATDEAGQLLPSVKKELHPVVLPIEFTTLKKGGPVNKNTAEAFVFRAGRKWKSNKDKNYIIGQFQQTF